MIGIRKIDVKFANPNYDCTRFILEWDNDEGIIVNVSARDSSFNINWEITEYLKEITYYNNRGSETTQSTDCDGIRLPLPGNNMYGDPTITIEFTDGTVITYNLPGQGNKLLYDLKDYVSSRYEVAPGRSEMSIAARLLDDEMQYEI